MAAVGWSRWWALGCAIPLLIVAGAIYGFGTLSDDVKERLMLSEAAKEAIGVSGNCGLWTGSAVGGLMADSRLGARVTMAGAAVLLLGGYQLFYRALLSPEASWVSPPVCCAAWFLVGHGSGWVYNASLFFVARQFNAADRAYVLGLLIMSFGMGPTIWATLLYSCIGGQAVHDSQSGQYRCSGGFPDGDVAHYIGLMSIVCPVLVLACLVPFGPPAPSVPGHFRPHFKRCLAGVLLVLGLVVLCNLSRVSLPGQLWTVQLACWGLLALLVLLLLVALMAALPVGVGPEDQYAPLAGPELPAVRLGQAVCWREFWLLVAVIACCVGSTVTVLNNLTTIVKDRNGGYWSDPVQVGNVAVVIAMATSAVARLTVGLAMFELESIPKVAYLLIGAGLSALAQAGFCLDYAPMILVSCVLLGLSDGCVWTAAPWLSSRVFGLKHVGSIFGCIVCLAAGGVLLLSNWLEPAVYQAHKPPGAECAGIECFRLTHVVCAGLSLVALVAGVALHFRLRQPREASREDNEEPTSKKTSASDLEQPIAIRAESSVVE